MIPVISLLLIVSLSLVVTRCATVALVHTGLGREAARFQARSAFTGVGFTTSEAETVVGHPVRRRIVMWLMLVGNVGIVTGMSSLLLSFMDQSARATWLHVGVLFVGLALIWLVAVSQWMDQTMCRAISWALRRWTALDARDYARLLHLREDYGVTELRVDDADWLAGKTVGDAGLAREGVLVLGIECPGNTFVGAPPADTEVRPGDRLILYGRTPRIAEIDRRDTGGAGDRYHADAVVEQERIVLAERASAGR